MRSYPKMLNLYLLDPETRGRLDRFSCPEFAYLAQCRWVCTEKIDGTNIRVIFDAEGNREVRGRTDRANLPQHLLYAIMRDTTDVSLTSCTLYGEGYGAGIQKGGWYRQDQGFALFDVFMHAGDDDGYYLPWHEVKETASYHNVPLVPVLGTMSLYEAHAHVQQGLRSQIGDDYAEGLVCRPEVAVRDARGKRLIVKVKHRDYFGKELVRAV